MFECLSCGERFEVPAVTEEMHFELFPPAKERFLVCPLCKDYDVVVDNRDFETT